MKCSPPPPPLACSAHPLHTPALVIYNQLTLHFVRGGWSARRWSYVHFILSLKIDSHTARFEPQGYYPSPSCSLSTHDQLIAPADEEEEEARECAAELRPTLPCPGKHRRSKVSRFAGIKLCHQSVFRTLDFGTGLPLRLIRFELLRCLLRLQPSDAVKASRLKIKRHNEKKSHRRG